MIRPKDWAWALGDAEAAGAGWPLAGPVAAAVGCGITRAAASWAWGVVGACLTAAWLAWPRITSWPPSPRPVRPTSAVTESAAARRAPLRRPVGAATRRR